MDKSMLNANRFLGFSDTYENARPQMPEYVIYVIKKYLGRNPNLVVDLGCGTGLSTVVWEKNCNQVIGVEPSEDMLSQASAKSSDTVKFIKGFAHETGLEDDSADVIVCSQSFHWMNPDLTLAEVNRILKKYGVFATVDCDWPPVCDWRAEKEYDDLFKKVKTIENTNPKINKTFNWWDKNKHLENIQNSGYFSYAREIVFANTEVCDAKRFINIALSQGSLQTILKTDDNLIKDDVKKFTEYINDLFKEEKFNIDFCYRMRIAVK